MARKVLISAMLRLPSIICLTLIIGLGVGVIAEAKTTALVYLGEGQEAIKQGLENSLKQAMPDIEVKFFAYQEPQTKQVIQKYNLRFLPFVSLDKGIIEDPNFITLIRRGSVDKLEDTFYIATEKLRPFGLFIVGNEKVSRQLDMYMVSLCRFGQPALRELINLIRHEGLAISLQVRFITTFRDYGVDSFGGPQEIKEDIRQLIIQKDYPEKFFNYILARQQMALADAYAAAELDSEAIEAKEQEAVVMLSQDAQLAASYGINSSPTFMWENQYLYFSWQAFKPVIMELVKEKRQEASKKQEERKEKQEEEKPEKKGWWRFGR